jgi:hypothetical protein
MGYKRFEDWSAGTVSVADLLQDRLENLRINQGTVLDCPMEVLQVYSTVVVSITEPGNYGRYRRACSIPWSK